MVTLHHVVVEDLAPVVRSNATWMTWNLLLAFLPAVLAPVVFRHRGPRTAPWWAGVALFALFLPNAPYVLTDLVHLRSDVVQADELGVVTAVLPVYGLFIGAGLLAYAVCLSELGRYLERVGLGARRAAVEVGAHLACAVGVVLGRVARLNSWEPVTEPRDALERAALTLSARWAVVAVVVLFAVIWVGHATTRALVHAARDAAGRAGARLHGLLFP